MTTCVSCTPIKAVPLLHVERDAGKYHEMIMVFIYIILLILQTTVCDHEYIAISL